MTSPAGHCTSSARQAAMRASQGQRSSSVSGVPARMRATLSSECRPSPSMKPRPSASAMPAATVDLPEPETPITTSAMRFGPAMSATALEPAVGAEMADRVLRITELLVQPGGVVVRVGQVGRELQADVVGGEGFHRSALVLERDRTVEVQQSFAGLAAQGLVVKRHRFLAALRFAEQRAEVQIGVGMIRVEREHLAVGGLGGLAIGRLERLAEAEGGIDRLGRGRHCLLY